MVPFFIQLLWNPSSTKNYCKRQNYHYKSPSYFVQRGFCTTCAVEHRASTGC